MKTSKTGHGFYIYCRECNGLVKGYYNQKRVDRDFSCTCNRKDGDTSNTFGRHISKEYAQKLSETHIEYVVQVDIDFVPEWPKYLCVKGEILEWLEKNEPKHIKYDIATIFNGNIIRETITSNNNSKFILNEAIQNIKTQIINLENRKKIISDSEMFNKMHKNSKLHSL